MQMRIQVVLDTERDADILRWLSTQTNRSAAIREALRAVLRPVAGLDVVTLRRVLREELGRVAVTPPTAAPAVVQDVDADSARRLDALF